MTTKDFIRHHTQLILEAEKKAEPVKADPMKAAPVKAAPAKAAPAKAAPAKAADSEKVERIGRTSGASSEAIGLASTNPKELLKRLGVADYKPTGKTNADKLLGFIKQILKSNKEMGLAFDMPEISNSNVRIPLALIGQGVTAIGAPQAPRYIRASIIAFNAVGFINFDASAKGRVQLVSEKKENAENDDDNDFFVRIKLS